MWSGLSNHFQYSTTSRIRRNRLTGCCPVRLLFAFSTQPRVESGETKRTDESHGSFGELSVLNHESNQAKPRYEESDGAISQELSVLNHESNQAKQATPRSDGEGYCVFQYSTTSRIRRNHQGCSSTENRLPGFQYSTTSRIRRNWPPMIAGTVACITFQYSTTSRIRRNSYVYHRQTQHYTLSVLNHESNEAKHP